MVWLPSLYLFAATLLLVAAVVGRTRRIVLREAVADWRAALFASLLVLASSTILFALSRPLAASPLWRDAASFALLASPLGATLALQSRGRRSVPRALLTASVAVAGLVLWLTLSLRGPRGGWPLIEVALVLPGAAVAVASAACFGWWSKREAVDKTDSMASC